MTIQVRVGVPRRARMGADKPRQYRGRSLVVAALHGLRIGPLVPVGFPEEPFGEICARVKAGSPFPHMLFCSRTNDHPGYVPIAEAYTEGGCEVETSPVLFSTADGPVKGTLTLLRQLADA